MVLVREGSFVFKLKALVQPLEFFSLVGSEFVFTSIFHGQHAMLEVKTIKLLSQYLLCG